jgi:flavin-dependent dehydrogenase
VQRGIDSYVLHTDLGSVRIRTPLQEKRIAAIHRGSGPRNVQQIKWDSFDGYLQRLAAEKGVHLIHQIVDEIGWNDGHPVLKTRDGGHAQYDLVTVAVGVNGRSLKLSGHDGFQYRPPQTTKTFIREYYLGEETVDRAIGSSMHVFLLNLPRLEFAAIIPKGDCVTVCLLGEDIDRKMVTAFLESPEVRSLLPADVVADRGACQCAPRMYTLGAVQPFADRILFIGDCGVSRLYKDGIGAAYRTAKAAATTAVFQGISKRSFRRHFWPVCQALNTDNKYGRLTFAVTSEIQKRGFARRALLRMTASEQAKKGRSQRMSRVLWDIFTGSEAYRNIIKRMLHPVFLGHLFWNLIAAAVPGRQRRQ